jgi:hypothetical protein
VWPIDKAGVSVGHFWKPYTGQAVGGKLDFMVLTGVAEDQAANQLEITCG